MIVTSAHEAEARIGSKAEGLRWLHAEGFSCPAFDAIDLRCWAPLLRGPEIRRHLDTLRFGRDRFTFSIACDHLRERVLHGDVPDEVAAWLATDPLARLGSPVAVRSSALGEDGAAASSAGQYESVLGVCDDAALVDAIRAVVSSYYGERAVIYRRTQQLDDEGALAMGVVVQQLVPARAAGIAFSIDPVTRSAEHVVVEATAGLGLTLVAGEADPDRFRVCRSDGQVATRTGRKAAVVTYDAERDELVRSERPPSGELCVTVDEVRRIAGDVIAMHERQGRAVDVEWVIPTGADALPTYVQVRPVTTFESKPRQPVLVDAF